MAKTDAASAVCEAIVHLLRSAMRTPPNPTDFQGIDPTFEVYNAEDYTNPDSPRHVISGASVFLYRVLPNLTHRTPAGRIQPNGHRQLSQLPLDLSIIISIHGEVPQTQNRLVGWVLRTLEDNPTLPASILNIDPMRPIFQPDEVVTLTLSEMSSDELLHFWEMLGNGTAHYVISLPYIARNLQIESSHTQQSARDVQIRQFDVQQMRGEAASEIAVEQP